MANGYYTTVLNRSTGDRARMSQNKNFLNGVRNAQNILKGLERSIQKSNNYENELILCKSSHAHAHSFDEWWQNESSDGNNSQLPNDDKEKSPRNQVDVLEPWSTMSIICMQYQHEELLKRYDALLQAYDEKCRALNDRAKKISRLRKRVDAIYSQFVLAHKTLLSVGEKYLRLRRKRMIQKQFYEDILESVNNSMQEVNGKSQQSPFIGKMKKPKYEVGASYLMSEIRKCNKLIMENLYLKTQIHVATPATSGSF